MGIQAALCQQILRRAFLCDTAIGQDDDFIRSRHGPHAVGDHKHCFVLDQAGESGLDQRLIFHIEGGCGFVQQNDGGIF